MRISKDTQKQIDNVMATIPNIANQFLMQKKILEELPGTKKVARQADLLLTRLIRNSNTSNS